CLASALALLSEVFSDGVAEDRQSAMLFPERQERAAERVACFGEDLLTDCDLARDLPVALPVGQLVGDEWVIHGWLDVAIRVGGPRGDRVHAGVGLAPIEAPDAPGVA